MLAFGSSNQILETLYHESCYKWLHGIQSSFSDMWTIQEIHRLLWKQNVWCHAHNPPLVAILSQINPYHGLNLPTSFCMTNVSIILTLLGEEYKVWWSPLYSFLRPAVTSSLLCASILPNILFSETFKPRTSHGVTGEVSHSYKTAGEITALYT